MTNCPGARASQQGTSHSNRQPLSGRADIGKLLGTGSTHLNFGESGQTQGKVRVAPGHRTPFREPIEQPASCEQSRHRCQGKSAHRKCATGWAAAQGGNHQAGLQQAARPSDPGQTSGCRLRWHLYSVPDILWRMRSSGCGCGCGAEAREPSWLLAGQQQPQTEGQGQGVQQGPKRPQRRTEAAPSSQGRDAGRHGSARRGIGYQSPQLESNHRDLAPASRDRRARCAAHGCAMRCPSQAEQGSTCNEGQIHAQMMRENRSRT